MKYCPYCGVDVGARFEQSFQQQSQQSIYVWNKILPHRLICAVFLIEENIVSFIVVDF